jgi:hypothetical protein
MMNMLFPIRIRVCPRRTPRRLLLLACLALAGLALGGCASSGDGVSSEVRSGFEPVAVAFLKNLKQELATPVVRGSGPALVYTLSGECQLDVRRSGIPESPYMGWINVRCATRVAAAGADAALGKLEFMWGRENGRWRLVAADLIPDGTGPEVHLLPPDASPDDPLTRRVLSAAAHTQGT